jgi:hypothetical protein
LETFQDVIFLCIPELIETFQSARTGSSSIHAVPLNQHYADPNALIPSLASPEEYNLPHAEAYSTNEGNLLELELVTDRNDEKPVNHTQSRNEAEDCHSFGIASVSRPLTIPLSPSSVTANLRSQSSLISAEIISFRDLQELCGVPEKYRHIKQPVGSTI